MINGETVFSKEAVQQFLRSLFFERLEKERANFFRILLLVLAAAVFSNFAEVFENSQIGEVSFYMVYLLLFTILIEQLSAAWSFSWKTAGMDDSVYERPGTCLFRGSFSSIRSCHGFCILSGGSSSGVAGGNSSSHFDSARG